MFISYRRWRLLDANRVQELARVQIQAEGPDCPFESVAANQLELRLEQALASLPFQYREVILLVAIEEMSPDAVGKICELKPAALRKRLSRARKLLAKKLRTEAPSLGPAASEAKA